MYNRSLRGVAVSRTPRRRNLVFLRERGVGIAFAHAATRARTMPNTATARAASAADSAVLAASLAAARTAGLRYVNDGMPGIRRERHALGFRYLDPNGRVIRDRSQLRRIHALVIPPAWQEVWICPTADGHIQATARDARGRKQYRYHPRWRAVRDAHKYGRMAAFGAALLRIRARTRRDLAVPGLPREKVLAAVVRLLADTLIRVGNESYARQNGSFGLTTFRDRHAEIDGAQIRFRFRGKSKKEHLIAINDQRLARVVRSCQELPGQTLFQYRGADGELQTIGSTDVNAYLRAITGESFTAKDFRTWAGTVLMAKELAAHAPPSSETAAKRAINAAIERVAHKLGNTRAVCRRCYIHPAVLDAYCDGTLADVMRRRDRAGRGGLRTHEAALLRVLRRPVRRDGPLRASA
jgi:DNA topoisomerase-1